jgi:hypothetical protein
MRAGTQGLKLHGEMHRPVVHIDAATVGDILELCNCNGQAPLGRNLTFHFVSQLLVDVGHDVGIDVFGGDNQGLLAIDEIIHWVDSVWLDDDEQRQWSGDGVGFEKSRDYFPM